MIANYGTNSALNIVELDGSTKYETFAGLNVGADYLIGNFSIGLMLIGTSKFEERINELKKQGYSGLDDSIGKIKLSLGYNF